MFRFILVFHERMRYESFRVSGPLFGYTARLDMQIETVVVVVVHIQIRSKVSCSYSHLRRIAFNITIAFWLFLESPLEANCFFTAFGSHVFTESLNI